MRDIVGLQISRKGRLIYKYHFLGPVDQLPINPQKPAFSEPSEITPMSSRASSRPKLFVFDSSLVFLLLFMERRWLR